MAAPQGLGDQARRQLAAAQKELSAGLADKGVGARGALSGRLADRKARAARMAEAEAGAYTRPLLSST